MQWRRRAAPPASRPSDWPPSFNSTGWQELPPGMAGIDPIRLLLIGQLVGLEGKNLTASARPHLVVVALTVSLAAALAGCSRPGEQPAAAQPKARALVSSIRIEPRGFNRYVGRDSVTETIAHLTQGKLVRIDRRTQELEPWLAESWSASADGLTYTLHLRQGVTFSDGTPFTSADVLFAFRAIYDERTHSALGESVSVGGTPLQVSATGPFTVVVRFPSPFGPGMRLLDNLPILPRHKLERALDEGTLGKAWDSATPVSEIVGLGPFVVTEYQAGQRLVFARNPRYWRKDVNGEPLPALDRLTLEIVPDQNAELLRLQAGQIDFTQAEIRPEDYATLKASAQAGRIQLLDLGVGLDADAFWINLRPNKAGKRSWLQRAELRRAISHAVDRHAFANTVLLGAGVPVYGPITPGNTRWYAPDLPKFEYDVAAARSLLTGLGLTDRDRDGVLEDRTGARAGFTILTMKGNSVLERGATFVRDELRKVGLAVEVAPLEGGALIERIERGEYETVFFRFLTTDVDPALNMDFWMSSGLAHVWNPSQPSPGTDWERQVDQLMARQAMTLDQAGRKALFDQAQRVFAEQLPVLQFAAPRIYLAISSRVHNAAPALLRPAILWDPDRLTVRGTPAGAH
ncbi:MAG: ABC transporter substrate-binding protein [Acidobacteria bacterium]|nr:MAG: ABC transporter substrate-binding protein [Acidobacteriota bacterium]